MREDILDEAEETVNGDDKPRHRRPQRCPPYVLKQLGEKTCPVCSKNCTPRKGGYGALGWFLGCPDFPKCPGKLPKDHVAEDHKVTEENKTDAVAKLVLALDFIKMMGGSQSAQHWLRIAAETITPPSEGV